MYGRAPHPRASRFAQRLSTRTPRCHPPLSAAHARRLAASAVPVTSILGKRLTTSVTSLGAKFRWRIPTTRRPRPPAPLGAMRLNSVRSGAPAPREACWRNAHPVCERRAVRSSPKAQCHWGSAPAARAPLPWVSCPRPQPSTRPLAFPSVRLPRGAWPGEARSSQHASCRFARACRPMHQGEPRLHIRRLPPPLPCRVAEARGLAMALGAPLQVRRRQPSVKRGSWGGGGLEHAKRSASSSQPN